MTNGLDSTAHMIPGTDCASDPMYVVDTINTCTNDDSLDNIQHPLPAYIDDLMTRAYGDTLLFSDSGDHSSQ